MTDRVPTYPGRVRLAPVSGQENVYDMTMADGATVEGTPLSKANLMTDATANKFAALTDDDAPATVNDALSDAADLLGDRARIEIKSYTGTGTYGSSHKSSVTFSFTPKIVLVFGQGLYANGPDVATWETANYENPGVLLWGVTTTMAVGLRFNTADVQNYSYNDTTNTMTWYNTYSASNQFNASGTTYYVAAIG